MDEPSTWWGVIALAITTVGGVATAWMARERPREVRVPEPSAPELAGADLSTLAGIATVVARQSRKISSLETEQAATVARLGALSRYIRVLQGTIRQAGLPVPEPDPSDLPLIDQQ
ncbi:hypothetical protein [Streptomyces sp. NPDC091212]|uniref:hypothetical protein n=1 Tax=Streptomyces sp. NPDC091212 TaxID=3155191 RepID=UPI00341F616C